MSQVKNHCGEARENLEYKGEVKIVKSWELVKKARKGAFFSKNFFGDL